MKKKKYYRKRRLNPKIKVGIFIILIILIFNYITNLHKPLNPKENVSNNTEKVQNIDNTDTEVDNQQDDIFLSGSSGISNTQGSNDTNNQDRNIPKTDNDYDGERDINKFKDKKLIAFTFDDGPSSVGTNKLLDNLNKYNARVTFFVVGNRVQSYKDTLKRAYDMGNLIGSHTYNHKNLLELNNNEITSEITNTNKVIKEITNSNTLYIRPPYGNTNQNIKKIGNMYTILWDLDTEDWKYKDKNIIAQYIVDNAHDGAIVLLHDLYETSVDGALLAMEELEKMGYAFVTIEEMATLKGITLDKTKSYFKLNN